MSLEFFNFEEKYQWNPIGPQCMHATPLIQTLSLWQSLLRDPWAFRDQSNVLTGIQRAYPPSVSRRPTLRRDRAQDSVKLMRQPSTDMARSFLMRIFALASSSHTTGILSFKRFSAALVTFFNDVARCLLGVAARALVLLDSGAAAGGCATRPT